MALTIHELPPEDRPREKLALRGADALSDGELIAILLRTGMQGANAIEVASAAESSFMFIVEVLRGDGE